MMVKRSSNKLDWLNAKNILELLGALITAIVFLGGIGYWKASIDYKEEILRINQEHNNAITNLRIEYNEKLNLLQKENSDLLNEIKMLKLSRKEVADE